MSTFFSRDVKYDRQTLVNPVDTSPGDVTSVTVTVDDDWGVPNIGIYTETGDTHYYSVTEAERLIDALLKATFEAQKPRA